MPDGPPGPIPPSSTPESVTTALSMLTARVAVLERWATRSRRSDRLTAMMLIVLLTWIVVSMKR